MKQKKSKERESKAVPLTKQMKDFQNCKHYVIFPDDNETWEKDDRKVIISSKK